MEAVVYSDGEKLRCIARGYPEISVVHFSADGMDSGKIARDLRPLRDLLTRDNFDFTIGDGTRGRTVRFEKFGNGSDKWSPLVDGIFDNGPEEMKPRESIYEKALGLCPTPECVIIEDSVAGISAIKEAERSGIARAYAVECSAGENPEKRIPSVAAWVGDVERFCELIGIFRQYGTWHGLLTAMRRSKPEIYTDISRISKQNAVDYYRTSE